jgi:peptide/nickel transport system substrate-binding protein
MIQKRLFTILSLIIVLVMALSACGPTAPPGQVPPRQAGKGGYLDEIDVSVVAKDSAISQIEAGAIDLYSFNLASSEFPAIKKSGLGYTSSYGGNYAIMLNPAKFKDESVLNPFSDRKIREAVNWLIDRNYANQEIYAGGSLAKFFPITSQLVDYTGLVDVARELETKYAFNLDKAKQVIADEMKTLGATAGADGKFMFKDKPVSLTFIIRSDGDGTRKPLGDYVAGQFEKVGFTVDRQYKKSSEASPIWIGSDPVDGKWNIYTAGWISPGLTRDEKDQFQQMYLPSSQQGLSVFLANVPDPEFQKVGDTLAAGTFSTLDERHDLMAKALRLAMEDSVQVFVIEQKSYAPYKKNVNVTYDLGSGVEAAAMYPYNLRFTDKEGGVMKIGTSDLFTEPWNTIGGDNWIWDTAIMRMTTQGSDYSASGGIMADPYTGLAWPQRIDKAEVTYGKGLPIVSSLGWVTLKEADTETIDVPGDVLIDWDAKAQKFITVAEKGGKITAKVKSVVVYPSNLFDTVKWQDGSPLSVADFIMPNIVLYDRGDKNSPIYDESAGPYLDSVKTYSKGFRITSTNPLTIESYSDRYYSDAELNVVSGWPNSPIGLSGENSWDVLAISDMAEAAGELAYSADKADAKKIEQMSWIGGPSLDILAKHLDEAIAAGTVPYPNALGQYLTVDQAKARYNSLKAWYGVHKHFFLGTGPYYVDKAFLTEKTITLKNNGWFTDASDRWAKFASPKLANVTLEGPDKVKVGDKATFKVTVTTKGSPYAKADIAQVKYLLYDSAGAVIKVGEATATGDGLYEIVLEADVTSKLVAGSDKIEVAVVPIPVAIPAFTSLDFVVTQ